MPTAVATDPNLISLQDTTGITAQEWADALTLPLADFQQWVADQKALGRMSWAHVPSTMDKVEAIMNGMVAIATPVTVITGGVSGIAGMIAALKGL
jgi:hypothetical protein